MIKKNARWNMIHHVVWWTLKDGVNGKSAKEAADYLVKLGMEKWREKSTYCFPWK